MTAMLEDRSIRAKIYDVREQRKLATPLTMRSDAASGQIILEGYAATFQPYDVFGGPNGGGWNEQLHNRAFDKTLSANPDVQLLVNHEGWPLARTKSGTLVLRADSHGLLVRASLDLSDPDVQRLLPKMKRKDMDEMSFAFRVSGQDWSSDYTQRLITEVNLQKGDVSVVNYGANPTTMATLSESLSALSELSSKELVELRNEVGAEKFARALQVMRNARASTPKKYSGVSDFADPGYLDSSGKPAKDGNGVKRYPLNSADRVRNAASRFAQNKDKYSSEQQSAIMGKIKAAAKKYGIDISDNGDSKAQLDHFDLRQGEDGKAYWVGVSTDGREAPVAVGAPAPDTRAMGDSFGAQPQWQPVTTGDIHDEGYTKENHDRGLTSEAPNPAAAGGPQISTATGYDPHTQAYGPVQMCSNNDGKDNKMDADERQNRLDEFRAPGDDDGEEMGMDKKAMDDEKCDDEMMSRDDDEMCASSDDDMDDRDDMESDARMDFSLAAALESTIVSCIQLAESQGDTDMGALLGRARRQITDLQGKTNNDTGDLDRKLNELRSEFGDPETITVTDGLRALEKAGYADMMHDQVLDRRAAAAEPFSTS